MSRAQVSKHCRIGITGAFLAFALSSAVTIAADIGADVRAQLAPTGKLRVGLIRVNQNHISKDGPPDEMQGVGVEIGRELAKRLGIAFEPVKYESVAALLTGLKSGEWDVAPSAYAPDRTVIMDFTAPYMAGGNAYLVPAESSIRSIADVDKPGHRVVAPPKSVQHAYLSTNLKHAEVVEGTGQQFFELLKAGNAHAWFDNESAVMRALSKRPEFRRVEGTIALGGASLAIAKGRPAGAAYAKAFIEEVKANGFIQRAIEQSGLKEVRVAPAAPAQ